MRLIDDAHDEESALETIAAAARAGVTVFDTARAYGDNERLLARALRTERGARVVTKGGMTRSEGGWIPDGRAKAIRADCEASLSALDGLAIDLYLIHAPDPRTPWRTSVRALARLADEGLVGRGGLANVTRSQLDEALELAPIAAVQVALSLFDDSAMRGGVVERCLEAGVAVIAHSPLGGPRRARDIGRQQQLVELAECRDATPAEVALAWLLGLSPLVVAIPGARRPETARSAVRAAALSLVADERAALARTFGHAQPGPARRPRTRDDGEAVLVMGIPGAGKSSIAEDYVARGYSRLNRDELGGSLRHVAAALESELASGVRRVVLDNTYLTRASRSYVVETAGRHRLPTRCVWLDTPLAQAQVNLVERLLERFGCLPTPEELRRVAQREPGLLSPTSQMRALRELEPPAADEGLADIDRVPFARRAGRPGAVGVFVAAAALEQPGWRGAIGGSAAPHLVFDWRPGRAVDSLDGAVGELAAHVAGPVESALCPHPAGPPTCWCRPPLPGLLLAFARTQTIDPARSTLIGTGPAHRQLAAALGSTYLGANRA